VVRFGGGSNQLVPSWPNWFPFKKGVLLGRASRIGSRLCLGKIVKMIDTKY